MARKLSIRDAVLYSPVALLAVYLVLMVVRMPRLLERLYWDSDGAVAMVVAETAGHGDTILGHYGWFSTLWLTQLTRWVPFHRELWEYAPYIVFLGTMAGLAWVSLKIGGRWAAAMTAVAAIATSPIMRYVSVSLNFHSSTWVGTAVVAVFGVWLVRTEKQSKIAAASVLMALYLGVTFASDKFFGFVGLAPFGVVGAVLLTQREKRIVGAAILAMCVAAVPVAMITAEIMTALNYSVWQAPSQFATTAQLWPDFGHLLQLVTQTGNGDMWSGKPLGLRGGLSLLSALITLAGVISPFVLLRRELKATAPSVARLTYATFWAACVTIDCCAYVFSTEGQQVGYYMMAVYYAAAATAPLLASRAFLQRLLITGAIAILSLTSVVNLADTKTAYNGGFPTASQVSSEVVKIAKQEHATQGYADYWDASSMSWSTNMAVHVQPVGQCALPAFDLCPYGVNVNTAWYNGRAASSFYLEDDSSMSAHNGPPAGYGTPTSTHSLGNGFTMYVYPYDIASKFNYSNVSWKPSGAAS